MISVNLTTTSSRLELCAATIWSLIHQSWLPDKINLWISHDAFMADSGIDVIPDWVVEINNIKNILLIQFVSNTGPYRKIFPALENANNDDILIYADDDVIYGSEWLKELLHEFYKKNGMYAIASRVKCIEKNLFGINKSYNMYDICTKNQIIHSDYIITGVGGCVITKSMIKDEFIYNKDYLDVAAKTDDLWISKILILSNTAVISCPAALRHVQEIQHYNFALSQTNTTIVRGGLIYKLYSKVINKILGYLGFRLSNNDMARVKIDAYFKNRRL